MSYREDDERNEGGSGREIGRDALDRIRTALRGLQFGTVTAIVQDGVIVQVERMEKIRLERREVRKTS